RAGALGTARLALENAGSVAWPPAGERRVCLGYHWLDELGNPIVWDGLWTALPHEVAPGERVEAELTVRGPLPPGPYRLPFDLDAHEEGYAAVGGSIAVEAGLLRRPSSALAPYAPGGGRNPAFEHPLLCPSVVREVEPRWAQPVEGLPALRTPADEPWLYDGRIQITARPRSGRRRG